MYTRPSAVLRAPRAMQELSTPPQATWTSRGRPRASAAAAVRFPMIRVDGTISGKSDAERPLASTKLGVVPPAREVVHAGARGVREVGERLPRQAQVDPVLGPEHEPRLREHGRLVVPVPHHLEDGVALRGEAVARASCTMPTGRPSGRTPRPGPRPGCPTRSGSTRAAVRPRRPRAPRRGSGPRGRGTRRRRPRPARAQEVAGAPDHGVPPVRGPLLVPPRVGVQRLVRHEGGREARAPRVVERRLRPAGAEVEGEDGLRHG